MSPDKEIYCLTSKIINGESIEQFRIIFKCSECDSFIESSNEYFYFPIRAKRIVKAVFKMFDTYISDGKLKLGWTIIER